MGAGGLSPLAPLTLTTVFSILSTETVRYYHWINIGSGQWPASASTHWRWPLAFTSCWSKSL